MFNVEHGGALKSPHRRAHGYEVRQVPPFSFDRHSLSSSPEVGFVWLVSKSLVGQLEQLRHQCHTSLPFFLRYSGIVPPVALMGVFAMPDILYATRTYVKSTFSPVFANASVLRATISPASMKQIGERIREIREELGWSQNELSRRSGVSKSFLSDLEGGQRNISTDYLSKLAGALGASVEYLMHGATATATARTIDIPKELSIAAEQEHWPHSDVLKLLHARDALVARRSTRSKTFTTAEWKEFAVALRKFMR